MYQPALLQAIVLPGRGESFRRAAPLALRNFLENAIRALDSAEETARIEGVGGIELMLDGFHEGQGIAGGAPGVERGEFGGAIEEDEGTAHFFKFGAQA